MLYQWTAAGLRSKFVHKKFTDKYHYEAILGIGFKYIISHFELIDTIALKYKVLRLYLLQTIICLS